MDRPLDPSVSEPLVLKDYTTGKFYIGRVRLDPGQLEVAEKLLNIPIKDVINEFAKIEELRETSNEDFSG